MTHISKSEGQFLGEAGSSINSQKKKKKHRRVFDCYNTDGSPIPTVVSVEAIRTNCHCDDLLDIILITICCNI